MGQLGQVCMLDYSNKKETYLKGVREGKWGSRILADTEWAGNNPEARIAVSELNEIPRVAVEESRLGIPLLFARDVIYGHGTVLPIPLAQAAAWDPALIEKAYTGIAREAAADGIHWTFSPMDDLERFGVAKDPEQAAERALNAGVDVAMTSDIFDAHLMELIIQKVSVPFRLFSASALGSGAKI